jgi:hypothetical protein
VVRGLAVGLCAHDGEVWPQAYRMSVDQVHGLYHTVEGPAVASLLCRDFVDL